MFRPKFLYDKKHFVPNIFDQKQQQWLQPQPQLLWVLTQLKLASII